MAQIILSQLLPPVSGHGRDGHATLLGPTFRRGGRTAFDLKRQLNAAILYQVVNHLVRGGSGKGFAVHQAITQVGHEVAAVERPARVRIADFRFWIFDWYFSP
jgi:hypothetical protein